jgi:molecular chaperone DnaK (HSP70)
VKPKILFVEARHLTSGIPVDITPLSLGIETVGGVMTRSNTC